MNVNFDGNEDVTATVVDVCEKFGVKIEFSDICHVENVVQCLLSRIRHPGQFALNFTIT